LFRSSSARGGNSALHLCAIHDRVECMKVLLRCGADPLLRNSQDKTALDLAQERGHDTCVELVSTCQCYLHTKHGEHKEKLQLKLSQRRIQVKWALPIK